MKLKETVFTILITLLLAVLLLSLPTMLLWNWLMPDLFGLKEIGFFQAIGINLLSTILIKGTGK